MVVVHGVDFCFVVIGTPLPPFQFLGATILIVNFNFSNSLLSCTFMETGVVELICDTFSTPKTHMNKRSLIVSYKYWFLFFFTYDCCGY